MILHFGVNDIPYVTYVAPKLRRVRVRSRRQSRQVLESSTASPSAAPTTLEVAKILEAKYHVMEVFYELHVGDIAAVIIQSLQSQIRSITVGLPVGPDPWGNATGKMDAMFKTFLSQREMDGLGIPGVPTMAAQMGVNHRLKAKKGLPRPSFIDTGTYESNFRAWFD